MNISVINTVALPITKNNIVVFVTKVLRGLHQRGEISILLCNDAEIKKINRKFLKKNRYTDVIAFYYNKKIPGCTSRYIGDIVISVDRAKVQAAHIGHSVKKELFILLIHGILHLLGYDDTTSVRKEKMFRKQAAIYKTAVRV